MDLDAVHLRMGWMILPPLVAIVQSLAYPSRFCPLFPLGACDLRCYGHGCVIVRSETELVGASTGGNDT
jgi:hypothetical protein